MSLRTLDRWDWACHIAPGWLTATQRVILLALTRHGDEEGRGAIIGQEKLARSAGIGDRTVRDALDRLEGLGLISGERRPGQTTVWTVHLDWTTAEVSFQGAQLERRKWTSRVRLPDPGSTPEVPRTPASRLMGANPGSTPEVPRTPASDEGEGEGEALTPEGETPSSPEIEKSQGEAAEAFGAQGPQALSDEEQQVAAHAWVERNRNRWAGVDAAVAMGVALEGLAEGQPLGEGHVIEVRVRGGLPAFSAGGRR